MPTDPPASASRISHEIKKFKAPQDLWVFLGVVLGRISLYYASDILAQDLIESVFDTAERWAIHKNPEDAQLLIELRNEVWEIEKPFTLEQRTGSAFSLLMIAQFVSGLPRDQSYIDPAMRHTSSILARSKTKPNDLRAFSKKMSSPYESIPISKISRAILTEKRFPRDMLIGRDPETTNAIVFELLKRKKRLGLQ